MTVTHRPDERLPLTVLTGFLGSGKTTLLNRLLRAPEMAGTLVIVNEFGDVGLDHLLIETPQDETILLENGCLCCEILGDLVVTLTRLMERRRSGALAPFNRVVIETTGLADPAPLLRTTLSDPDISGDFQLDTVVTVIDAVNGSDQLDRHFESVKQAAAADRLVVSKSDLAAPGVVSALRERLRRLNAGADTIVAVQGDVSPARLIGARQGARDWQAWLGEAADTETSHDPNHHGRHRHLHRHRHRHEDVGEGQGEGEDEGEDGIGTFTLRRDTPVTREGLRLWLNALARFKGPKLLRMKGLINVEGAPVVVQAVQQLFHEPQELTCWPSADIATRLVFIVHGLARAEIETTLAALDFGAPQGRVAELGFDGADYGRFVAALRNFEPLDRM